MTFALVLSALLMGLAGSVHCLAMCGAASTAVVRSCRGSRATDAWWGFHAGRVAGYAAAGALAASSVMVLGRLGQWSPVLRPLWTLAHLAAMGLGLWLLWQGRQPVWLDRLGRADPNQASALPGGWQRVQGPMRSAAVGAVWFAWPCGLLQSALMVAALANGPVGGCLVMAVFALASGSALGIGQAAWARLSQRAGWWQSRWDTASVRLITRISGAALAAASAWALGHDLWVRFAAWCFAA